MLTATDDQTRAVLDWFFFERTEEAFCRLFQVMFPKLKRHLLLCGLADDDAEQVAVDSLYTVYVRIADVRDPATFAGWVYKIARNGMLKHLRRSKIEANAIPIDPSGDELQHAVRYLDSFSSTLELRNWLGSLDSAGRDIMLLRFVDGLEYHEIAQAMAIPIGTVKWKISDCKLKLARSLGVKKKA